MKKLKMLVFVLAIVAVFSSLTPVMAAKNVTAGKLESKPVIVKTGEYTVKVRSDKDDHSKWNRSYVRFVAPKEGKYTFTVSNLKSGKLKGLFTSVEFGQVKEFDGTAAGMGHYKTIERDVRKKNIPGGIGDVWGNGTFEMRSNICDKSLEDLYIKYSMSEYDYTEEKAEKEFSNTDYAKYVYKTKYTVSLKKGEIKDIGFDGLHDAKSLVTAFNRNTTANNFTIDLKISKK